MNLATFKPNPLGIILLLSNFLANCENNDQICLPAAMLVIWAMSELTVLMTILCLHKNSLVTESKTALRVGE